LPPEPIEPAAITEEPLDAGELERRARGAEGRLAEVVEAYRQLKADNEGYRDRTTRNLERRFEQRRESLLLKFIDILDNMDRALEAAQTAYAEPSLLEGLILVRTQLLQTLQEEGLERIPVLGLPFDPHVSEAVATEPVDDPDQNQIVVKELLRGYRLNGRVVRPSRVVMAEYVTGSRPARDPEAAAATPPDGDLTLEQIIARAEEEARGQRGGDGEG
jgi:molecular chaperone GrpE